MIFIWLLLLLIGFIFLWKGADLLIDESVSLAKTLQIPAYLIGFTIVAFGTSLPELIVNVFASLKGEDSVVFGNIIGSNISNILLILGLSIFFTATRFNPKSIKSNLKNISLVSLAWVMIMSLFSTSIPTLPQDKIKVFESLELNWIGAVFLLTVFVGVLIKEHQNTPQKESIIQESPSSPLKSLLLITSSCLILFVGGKCVVEGALGLAELLHLSKAFVSLFVVALGTSLPELATAIAGIKKNQTSLVLGNIFGSNIFNICLILSLSALVQPLSLDKKLVFDIAVMITAPFLLYALSFLRHAKLCGFLSVSVYASYILLTYMRL